MTKKIAQNLSSTTLFNFTDQFHFLLGNLRNGFYCGDYYEKLPFTKNSGYKVPMVCFCDIPLGMVKVHLRWYGTYGIGIKRDYARFHNVCPVWYIHKDNPVIKSLFNSVNHNALKNSPILPYLKMFYGYQKPLNGIKEEPKKFYDEKEWRYIPQSMEWSSEFLRGTSHKNNAILTEENKRETFMPINLKSVEYIIVESENEKPALYDELRNLGIENIAEMPTVITSVQIRKDF